MRNLSIVRFSLVLLGLVLAPPLAGAAFAGPFNFVANPGFDANIGGWINTQPLKAAFDRSPADEDGNPGSGSLRFSGMSVGLVQTVSACFGVDPGDTVVFGASVATPGSSVPQSTGALLQMFSGPACNGDYLGSAVGDLTREQGSNWGPLQGVYNAPAAARSARLALEVYVGAAHPPEVLFDNAFVYANAGTCAPTATVACLDNGRFRVSSNWLVPDGTRGAARIRGLTRDTAYASFFDPDNVEVVIKVLDACGYNDRFWVFAAGLTNVELTLTVTDTVVHHTWSRTNPLNQAFAPIQDTNAFHTCNK